MLNIEHDQINGGFILTILNKEEFGPTASIRFTLSDGDFIANYIKYTLKLLETKIMEQSK